MTTNRSLASETPDLSVEASNAKAPTIYRASGPNRAAVVLDCLRLVRTTGCAIRTLAGKVFDYHEFSVIAEVLGAPANRLRLARYWDEAFSHETSKTGVRTQYGAGTLPRLGTHLIEATGHGYATPLDILDLLSGEFVVPINVAFIRRGARSPGRPVRYTIQLVIELAPTGRAKFLFRELRRWGRCPDRSVRIVPLLTPPEFPTGADSGDLDRPDGPPSAAAPAPAPVAPLTDRVGARPDLAFQGGVDLV